MSVFTENLNKSTQSSKHLNLISQRSDIVRRLCLANLCSIFSSIEYYFDYWLFITKKRLLGRSWWIFLWSRETAIRRTRRRIGRAWLSNLINHLNRWSLSGHTDASRAATSGVGRARLCCLYGVSSYSVIAKAGNSAKIKRKKLSERGEIKANVVLHLFIRKLG